MTYSNQEKYVTNFRVMSTTDNIGEPLVNLAKAVNKTYEPGHWNQKDEAGPLIDEMTGREIKSARDVLRKEMKRLEDVRKALRNTLEYMDKRIAHTPDDTFDDLL